jgi:hypothetical protein
VTVKNQFGVYLDELKIGMHQVIPALKSVLDHTI